MESDPVGEAVRRRARQLLSSEFSQGQLVAFHSELKMLLLAYSPEGYRALGRLVAHGHALERAELAQQYLDGIHAALAKPPTRGRHVNALQHLAGHFKDRLDDDERHALEDIIERYRRGLEPLEAAAALLLHHARRLRVDYVAAQLYLQAIGDAP